MALTGVIREHVFVINHGQGRNGKGVFQRMLTECIGLDYCQAAPAELFMTKGQGDAHPTEKMVLFGKRLVFVSETEEGKALNVALVKQLSGGDPITARKMRQDFVTFDPTHHILLATNGKPRIKDTGHAIWARIRLIPWDVSFEGREDHGLEMALRGELQGILAWAVEGCYEWQERGLDTPRAILDASAAYRAAEDLIGQFLEESCVFAEHHSIRVSDLRRAYVEWCSRAEVYPASPQVFNAALDVRRIRQSVRSGQGGSERRWLGVMLA
jgi:putative DNA primase/helicase